MRRLVNWIWSHGILATFLTGLFAILPARSHRGNRLFGVVTFVQGFVGPETFLGERIEQLGSVAKRMVRRRSPSSIFSGGQSSWPESGRLGSCCERR